MSAFVLANSDQSHLASVIRKALGVGPDEPVHVMTPDFDRPREWGAVVPGAELEAWWRFFPSHARDDLRALGCRPFGLYTVKPPRGEYSVVSAPRDAWYWEEDDEAKATHELWLFPAEWYSHIPNGFPVTDIFGGIDLFIAGKTDDDRRFGMLSFGVMIPYTKRAESSPMTPAGRKR